MEPLLLQPLQAVEDGVVFKGRGNDVRLALLFPQHGPRKEGLIVGLAAAGGECDLPLPGSIQAFCHILPGLQKHFCRLLARRVEGRGVAPGPVHSLQQNPAGRCRNWGGSCIVRINTIHMITLCIVKLRFISKSGGSRLHLRQSENRPVDKYRSPPSGRITARTFPWFSGRSATRTAAASAAPEEMPTRRPSSRATSRTA